MNFHKIKTNKVNFVLLIILTMAFAAFVQGQDVGEPSTVVFEDGINRELPVAGNNNLYCAGYIGKDSFDTSVEMVAATDEKDKHIYAQGDDIYISAGATKGVQVGDMYSVIRPRGKVNSKWTNKKSIGVYVQELGAVEVIRVMNDVSVAKVKTSCGVILFGDLLTKVPVRQSPVFKKRADLDVYAMSSGKANGKILMARDGIELLGRDQIVYVDLGREDNVQVGDYMTIYRPLGTGNFSNNVLKESIDNKEDGYESDRYRGGTFSNQSARKKGQDGNGAVVTTENAKSRRPDNLRRVVGELVILNVSDKTATAVIVRNASEIHTGDSVELQ